MAAGITKDWTEATWNPTTGCDRISPGCDNCYALSLAARLKASGSPVYRADGHPRTSGPGFGVVAHEELLEIPRGWRSPRVVFVGSMSDLWHARVPRDFIHRVFDVMAETPWHTYQVLTKRPTRLARMAGELPWPPNVWVGVTIEGQAQAWRADRLREVPAAVRFISAEPLLGPLELDLTRIDWLIAGAESGPGSRPMDPRWASGLRDQCERADTAFFLRHDDGGVRVRTDVSGPGQVTWDDMPLVEALASCGLPADPGAHVN